MDETALKIKNFFKQYKLIEYQAKETIVNMLEEPTGIYYVSQGFVKMNTLLANGNEFTVNILKPGSYFPLIWGLAKVQNNFLFQTTTKAFLYKAPRKDFVLFIEKNSDILLELNKRILSGMDGMLTNILHLFFGSAESRVASVLLLSSKRFGVKKGEKIILKIRLTHQDIANLAGLTRETSSIEIGKLTKNKIIARNGGYLQIIDMDKLIDLSQTS